MIRVGFSTTDNLLSKIIRKFTGSRISHCWFLFPWCGREWVLEAGFLGVRIIPWESYREKVVVIDIIDMPHLHILDLLPALNRLGDAYDVGGLIGAGVVVAARWFKKKIRNPFNNAKAMFCYELIVDTLEKAGEEKIDGITPDDLHEFLQRK